MTHFKTANEAWVDLLQDLLWSGAESAPRGKRTKEILASRTTHLMSYPLVTLKARKMGYKFAVAEAHWILSGDDRVASIAPYSRTIAQFSDNGETFFGAYGVKVEPQLAYVIEALRRDVNTRQAVLTIWRESPPETKDIPCTVALQWLIRPGPDGQGLYLHCIDTMRSSDAWLGWVYDVFNFTMVSSIILMDLQHDYPSLELGFMVLQAGSQHVYETNYEGLSEAIKTAHDFTPYPRWDPRKRYYNALELMADLARYKDTDGGALTMLEAAP